MLSRKQYRGGDTYMFFAWFNYMSDIHSAAGDENGDTLRRLTRKASATTSRQGRDGRLDGEHVTFSGGKNLETLGELAAADQPEPAEVGHPGQGLDRARRVLLGHHRHGKYPFEGKTYPTRLTSARAAAWAA